jgi:hypothetical protein
LGEFKDFISLLKYVVWQTLTMLEIKTYWLQEANFNYQPGWSLY